MKNVDYRPLIRSKYHITIRICTSISNQFVMLHDELGHSFGVVQVEARDGNIEGPVAHERKEGRIVQAERPVAGYAGAKDLDLVLRALLEPLQDYDIDIPATVPVPRAHGS